MTFLKILMVSFIFGFIGSQTQGSNLPTCKGDTFTWTNCFGTWVAGESFGSKFEGDKYIGEFMNAQRHGQGTYYFHGDTKNKGDIYVGEHRYDKFHGQGTYTWANGYKNVGEYKDNQRNGESIQYYPNGSIYRQGVFKDDKFLYTKKIVPNINNSDNFSALSNLMDNQICNIAATAGKWDKNKPNYVKEAKYRGLNCGVNSTYSSKNSKQNFISSAELENQKLLEEQRKRKQLEKKLALLEKEKESLKSNDNQKLLEEQRKRKELEKKLAALQSEKKKQIEKAKQNEIGSGFYVSKFRHIVTNQHVVNQCKNITVGDSMSTQIPANLIVSDKRNDLAILQTVSMDMASAETKSFLERLSIEILPVLSGGLMRSEDVSGGEEILVAGYPLGNMVSDAIKVTKGIVSATKGMDNDVSQFEIDAVIRKGNSGGPVYDKRGNIVGVAVSRLNINKAEYVNFGIKGSTVKQFLTAHDVPTKWSSRKDKIDTKDIYKIASKQTVMVVCHRD